MSNATRNVLNSLKGTLDRDFADCMDDAIKMANRLVTAVGPGICLALALENAALMRAGFAYPGEPTTMQDEPKVLASKEVGAWLSASTSMSMQFRDVLRGIKNHWTQDLEKPVGRFNRRLATVKTARFVDSAYQGDLDHAAGCDGHPALVRLFGPLVVCITQAWDDDSTNRLEQLSLALHRLDVSYKDAFVAIRELVLACEVTGANWDSKAVWLAFHNLRFKVLEMVTCLMVIGEIMSAWAESTAKQGEFNPSGLTVGNALKELEDLLKSGIGRPSKGAGSPPRKG